jgi:hypothetical protein
MAPFFSRYISFLIHNLKDAINQLQEPIAALKNQQHSLQIRLEQLLDVPDSEERINQLLQENIATADRITTLERDIVHMRRRVEELNLKYHVALCREEHQRRYGWRP